MANWTQEEIAYLKTNYDSMSAGAMAKEMGTHGAGSLRIKLHDLGIFKVRQNEQKKREKPTLCWDCKNACGGCPWSKHLVPVGGWTAKKTTIRASKTGEERMPSYLVIGCPEFVRDKQKKQAVDASGPQKKVSIFANSPCETACRNEKRNQCLQNNGRCAKWEKWFAESGIWQRTVGTLQPNMKGRME